LVEYKEARVLTRRSAGLGEERVAETAYRVDYLGRMEEIEYPDGEVVKYGYDYGGNVVSVRGEKQGKTFVYVEDIGYDAWGQRVWLKLGNGVETRYEYDEERRWLQGIRTESRGGYAAERGAR
jgi:hypothetical protein